MAKGAAAANAISLEAMDSLLTKFMGAFTETIEKMMSTFSETLNTLVDCKLTAISTRLDALESSYIQNGTLPGIQASGNSATAQPIRNQTMAQIVAKTYHELEQEKEQLHRKSLNVIITGLKPIDNVSDKSLVEQFCEEHLTVKPTILQVKRLPMRRSENSRNAYPKLCVTLSSAENATDLLSAATILRESEIDSVNKIYFNRDLTKAQAEAEYQARCSRRARKQQTNI